VRKINTGDVFILARIMKNGNVKDVIARFIESGKTQTYKTNPEAFGMEIFSALADVLADKNVEPLVYTLLSGITEKSENDIKAQSIDDLLADLKQIATENNVASFFKTAGRLGGK